ncbi:Membrane carboxypeptidase (penicillin-binding protein) [Jatrophihabitans endophyticus]|uniref:Membrane carboxypeptidase (Penicillin-binding protein) n=1 Tax=Jatrophihabitans endophyticus TaxID=1206085 RepID=A0A1M5IR66_9ACTN|nr:transglycosylase domain-containing protein [Jatrophihabitans endophyticus]SHG30460.1 Membrane carboxypeptidase (penicillin-binding protein) [Jatrophihabitans endophyticus]
MADSRAPRRRPSPTRAQPVDDWNDGDYEDAGFFATRWHKRSLRRRRTKARVAAMSRRRRFGRRVMILSTWALGLVASLMVAAIVLFYTLTDVPRPEDLPRPQVATIQYSDGSTLARIGTEDRTNVHLSQVPEHVRWAVLAAEDRNFYSDSAISIRGTARAALSNISGGDTQGGSGITQQYVKNAYSSVGTERTVWRKLKELMIAVKLSREYSKDQILEYYLNTVYFGRGAYGIQAAARAFFGRDVEKLTTAQGAVLAGLLRAPAYYDPLENKTAAVARWQYVLDGMVKTGHLTGEQQVAMKFPKTQPLRGNGIGVTGWKYLLKDAVLAELARNGISARKIAETGAVIRTTIDKKAQSAALTAIRQNFSDLTKKQRNLKNALVAIRPDDGAVLAYYGGSGPDVKGYDGKVDYNDYATRGTRPPGSSFKPYVLATALTDTVEQAEGKAHYTIKSKVDGSFCRTIEGTKICNDDGDRYLSGPAVSLSNAMKYSLNTTFDLLASETGPDDVASIAHRLGISYTDPNGKKTLVDDKGRTTFGIGIGDYPVTVLDQANGYATLQNRGIRNEAHLVSKVTSSDGAPLYSFAGKRSQAVDKRVANDVTLTLEPIAGYTGVGLANGRQSAAKTGTAGVSGRSKDNSDAWMVGYTPQVSAAVWVGTGYSKPIYNSAGNPLYGKGLPAQTWKTFMDTYLRGSKKMSMAEDQQVAANGKKPAPKPTYTAPVYTPSPTDSSDETSTSPSTEAPSTTAAPSTTSPPSTPSRTRTRTSSPTPTNTCGGLLGRPCSTSPGG